MTSAFHQCEAVKPSGERCRRVAQHGAPYCHSHRYCKARPIAYPHGKVVVYGDVDLVLTDGHGFVGCCDCGEWIEQGSVFFYPLAQPGQTLALCGRCYALRVKVEDRILEICNRPEGLSREKIHEALEQFGVLVEMAEAARLRMHQDGRLVYKEPGGRT